MTVISYSVKDSVGSLASGTVTATVSTSNQTWFAPKCAPIFWSGSATGGYGCDVNNTWSNFLGSTALSSIKGAGFDGLRVGLSLGICLGQSGTALSSSISSYVALVKSIAAAGLKVLVVGNADMNGFTGKNVFDGVSGPNWTKLKSIMATVAQQLAQLPTVVAFEGPCNEPQPNFSDQTQYFPYIKDFIAAIRAVVPQSGLVIAGDFLQNGDQMAKWPASVFPAGDPNIWAAMHDYPEPWGQEGMPAWHRYLNRIPVPPPADLQTRLQELKDQINAYNARIAAAGVTDSGQLNAINWYYGNNQPWSSINVPRDLTYYINYVKNNYLAWANKVGVKLMLSEGGCTGDNSYTGSVIQGADVQSRINGYIMVRTAYSVANNIPWCPQQLFGLNGTQGQGLTTKDSPLAWDAAMVTACLAPLTLTWTNNVALLSGAGWVAR